jgi:hypothetical protein
MSNSVIGDYVIDKSMKKTRHEENILLGSSVEETTSHLKLIENMTNHEYLKSSDEGTLT